MRENIKQALHLAGRGLRVFPLLPDMKRPAFAGWQAAATSDPSAIRTWYEGAYADSGVGVATGQGVFVVDADGVQGRASLDVLEMSGADIGMVVDTPSGGRHAYFTAPDGQWVPNSVKSLSGYPGIDIRGDGGFVAAPGSSYNGKPYTLATDGPLPLAPDWLVSAVVGGRKQRDKADSNPLVELDTEPAIARAIEYLRDKAPGAVAFAFGNDTTYKVAAKVKDFGISEEMTTTLLAEHWNETKAEPPWDIEEIMAIVANAYAHGTSSPGAISALAEFDAVSIDEPANDNHSQLKNALTAGKVHPDDLLNLPPRQWLYGYKIQRKYVSFLVSPGGVGKTAWEIAAGLAMASHQNLLGDTSRKPLRVWVYNLEDDMIEMRRRLSAAIQFHKLPPETLDNFRLNSGRDRRFQIVKGQEGVFTVLPDFKLVIEEIKREAIDVLFVDPYLRSHNVSENENEAQDEVMRLYAQIAEATNCAIVLVHHTKKNATPGEMDSMRGGSTQGGGARAVITLSPMSAEEAAKLAIPERLRRLYVRVSDAKNNMAPPLEAAEWFKLESFDLANGDDEYPEGDNVQVAARWEPPAALEGMNDTDGEEALATIGRGLPNGERYSARPQDKERWAGTVLMEQCMRSHSQAKEIVNAWIEAGVLEVQDYRSVEQRKERKGLFLMVDPTSAEG